MDRLTSIKVFRQVVESGSFVRAAERLELSTAMVSKHVMALEKRLQLRLLNRTSHKLSLTEPGKLYFERCSSILQDLHETELELEALRSAPRGTLRIAFCDMCIPGLGLAGVLAEYRRRWPEVVLDISFPDRNPLLAGSEHDLAFRVVGDEALPPDMVARPVRPVAFRLAASREYLERHGVPKVPEDLSRHDFVAVAESESLVLEGSDGPRRVPVRVAWRCRTMADVAIAVGRGVGLALLPAALCSDPAFAGVLRPVLTEYRLKESTLYVLYRSRSHLPPKARHFIDLVLAPGLAAGGREHPHTACTTSKFQYAQRTPPEKAREQGREARVPSVDPFRSQPGERGARRPTLAGAY